MNWLTLQIIHYLNDNGSFPFPLSQIIYLQGVLYETGTNFPSQPPGFTNCFWWIRVALFNFSVLCCAYYFVFVLCLVSKVVSGLSMLDRHLGFL